MLFAGIATLIHLWALLVAFDQMPALLNKMEVWTALSVLAYVLLVALIESLLVTGCFLLIVMLFPKDALSGRRAVLVALFSILAFMWLIPSHYPTETTQLITQYLPFLSMWVTNMVWAVLFILVCIFLAVLLRKKPAWMERIHSVLDRLTVLAGFYLVIDVIGILMIILANLS